MKFLNICKIRFIKLIIISFRLFLISLYFLNNELVYFLEWEVIVLNSTSIVITFLFDWISLLFMRFVLLISSLVIFYYKELYLPNSNLGKGRKIIISLIDI